MKAVLISIQPQWCEKIASGEKTIEVRKRRPNIDGPFKVYIYQTKHGEKPMARCCGVIGEFVCDFITRLTPLSTAEQGCVAYFPVSTNGLKAACLTMKDLIEYGNGKNLYRWHISNLVIYDKPKEITNFKSTRCNLQRPPQSWCYVEV